MIDRPLVAFLAIFLAGCSGGSSNIGSFNPFGSLGSLGSIGSGGSSGSGSFSGPGSEQSKSDVAASADAIEDEKVLVETVADVRSEAALRGVIVRATGISPTQGYSRAELDFVDDGAPDENGIVRMSFRVLPPDEVMPAGPQRTRELVAARFFSDNELDQISEFRIRARTNEVIIRR